MKKMLIFVIIGVLALGIGTSIQVRANPIQEYETIERINFVDDNWEFTTIPFTINDNWNEYGIRYFLNYDDIYSGVLYFGNYAVENEQVLFVTAISQQDLILGVLDTEQGEFLINLYGLPLPTDDISWVELIRVIPNIDTKYNEGFNEGYSRGVSQNFSSFGSFLTNSVGSFLNFEIFPGFSIMNVLWAILGVLLFIIILRVFAGG